MYIIHATFNTRYLLRIIQTRFIATIYSRKHVFVRTHYKRFDNFPNRLVVDQTYAKVKHVVYSWPRVWNFERKRFFFLFGKAK